MNTKHQRVTPRTQSIDFVLHLATSAVKSVLAPVFRTKASSFLVALVTPDPVRIDDYVQAAERLLEEYGRRCGFDDDQHNATAMVKPFSDAMKRSVAYDRTVLIVDPKAVDATLSVACDRMANIPSVSIAHVRSAMKAVFSDELTVEDALVVTRANWNDLRLAFRKGRPPATCLSRLPNKPGPEAKSKVPSAGPNGLRLEDMAGYGEASEWGFLLAHDIAEWRAGRITWAEVDRGIVLAGPPGVGKTVFAQALANSCAVPLVKASLASWQAMGYLNDLLKAMRKSFEDARKQSPAILFVDEVDSVGSRAAARGENASYHHQVVNAFLEQLDGSENRDGVVVVAATNRPWEIDNALLRPGRLERVIEIPLPDDASRAAILGWHSGLSIGISSRLVSETEGWSGADLEMLVRTAKRAARQCETTMTIGALEGALPERIALSSEAQWRIAIHECGHALIAIRLGVGRFEELAVGRWIRRGNGSVSVGQTRIASVSGQVKTAEFYLNRIAFTLGGIAAEKLVFGDFSDGVGGAPEADLCQATTLGTEMVAVHGMDDFLIAESSFDGGTMLHARTANPLIWSRVNALLHAQLSRAVYLLNTEARLLKSLARHALTHGRITPEVMAALVKPKVRTSNVRNDRQERS